MEQQTTSSQPPKRNRRKKRWRIVLIVLAVLIVLLVIFRMSLPSLVRQRVNHILNQNPIYAGHVDAVDISLYRGAYTIHGVKITKTTGNIPLPFITAKKLELAIQWQALFKGSLVGQVNLIEPELNFVDAPDSASSQAGGNGPWLEMITGLFPLRINQVNVVNGKVTFHAYHKTPQVNLQASELNLQINNLTNIRDEVAPLITTIKAQAMIMGQAKCQFDMKLDPFSYYPSFDMRFRMLGLDVTKLNSLTRAYGMFDYEHGFFDLVVQLKASEGELDGFVQPLFRNIGIINARSDLAHGNIIKLFWEALIGGVVELLKNQPHDQFATRIPIQGSINNPETDLLQTFGNILRNAFVRAYLPKLPPDPNNLTPINQQDQILQFKAGSIIAPGAPGNN